MRQGSLAPSSRRSTADTTRVPHSDTLVSSSRRHQPWNSGPTSRRRSGLFSTRRSPIHITRADGSAREHRSSNHQHRRSTLNRLARHAAQHRSNILALIDQINEKDRIDRLPRMYSHIFGRTGAHPEMHRIIDPPHAHRLQTQRRNTVCRLGGGLHHKRNRLPTPQGLSPQVDLGCNLRRRPPERCTRLIHS